MEIKEHSIVTIEVTRQEAADILSFLEHLPSGQVFNSAATTDLYNKLCEIFKKGIMHV